MAKWGEGDPRWIVEERPDGTNVNNWHWTEKNATNWSKDKLKELLNGLIVEDDECYCEINSMTTLDGEASANNRKGKLIFFYEWTIAGEWSGNLKDGVKKHKGKFEIPNLSEENEADEVNFEVTIDKTTDESYKVKEMMRKKGQDLVRKQIAKYMKELKEEYGKGIVLPTKGSATTTATEKKHTENKMRQEMNKMIINQSKEKVGVRIHTKTLTDKEEFKCRAEDLYRALTDKEMVQAFTSGPVSMEVEKGGRFSFLNGNITGEFVELVQPMKIVQRWRVKNWPEEHYSVVTFDLVEKEDCTVLNITQTGVPDTELEKTREGWKVNYWNRIKQIFGFGSNIFC
ncbi:activator of 90 kDa heat shock protein ATPase homolog 2-like [Mizuhopecten yessoensis]|uniref:activator of 90 kDa heat shock protein ATPase homolog 2-like n=1 Tax=Mizuhopecten yessoensis TaxID=6573 RepID=UPI000B45A119|nr:activator of 90 kDa heat shock protein ATPase homolog 2-like [Mizuhopecten yessoensis]